MPVRMPVIRLLTLFVAIVFTFSTPFPSYGANKPPVKVAALYNVTGGMASIDAPAMNGAKLAAKLANARGGVLGGRMIDIVPFDTRTDLKAASSAAATAAKMDVIAGVGYGDSDFVLAAAPYFQVQGVPFVTSGATDPSLPRRIGNRLFLAAFGDDDQASVLAEFAYEQLKARRIVILTDSTTDFTKTLSRFFRDRFESRGGKIEEEAFFKSGDTNFSGLTARIKSARPKPDCVLVASGPGEAGLLVKQIRGAGITVPILGGDSFDTDLVLSVPGPELANQVFFSCHLFPGDKRPEALNFEAAYQREYGVAPPNAFAALGYDAVGLIIDAIKRADTADVDLVATALSKTNGYDGVTGRISYLTRPGTPMKPVSIVGIKNGRKELMGVWEATYFAVSYSH